MAEVTYESLLAFPGNRGRKPSADTLRIEALEPGDFVCFGASDRGKRTRITNAWRGHGYINRTYPERRFISRVVDGQLYVARLKPEDIK